VAQKTQTNSYELITVSLTADQVLRLTVKIFTVILLQNPCLLFSRLTENTQIQFKIKWMLLENI